MGDFSPMTTAPSGPSISGETQTTCVYHFDKFVKHSGVFGQEAVKERYLRYGLQNHFHNLLVQPFGSSSKAEVGKNILGMTAANRHRPYNRRACFSLFQ